MPRTKVTLASLMVAVAVIAFELALWRTIFAGSMFLRIALTPIAIAVHLGLLGAIRRCDAARWFWAGFAASGVLASFSLAWYVPNGESPWSRLWESYFRGVGQLLKLLPVGIMDRIEGDWWGRAASVLIYTAIPQLAIAGIGGFVLFLFIKVPGREDTDRLFESFPQGGE